MSKDIIDILIEKKDREDKFFKNYLHYAKLIKEKSQKLLGPVRVFVFGSILRKNEIPNDIDIMVVSSELKDSEQRNKIRLKIWEKIGTGGPFEIHLITPEEYENWYSHFIKDEKLEI